MNRSNVLAIHSNSVASAYNPMRNNNTPHLTMNQPTTNTNTAITIGSCILALLKFVKTNSALAARLDFETINNTLRRHILKTLAQVVVFFRQGAGIQVVICTCVLVAQWRNSVQIAYASIGIIEGKRQISCGLLHIFVPVRVVRVVVKRISRRESGKTLEQRFDSGVVVGCARDRLASNLETRVRLALDSPALLGVR